MSSLKGKIKKILPKTAHLRLRFYKNMLLSYSERVFHGQKRYTINTDEVSSFKLLSRPKMHCFFGYYDLQQLDESGEHALAICVPKGAEPDKATAEVGYFTVADGIFHKIADTHAWCWQQGARLRWNNVIENTVLYNDMRDGKYVCICQDINTKDIIHTYPMALYDVTPDGKYGVSLNYSRLQRLRAGYGYSVLEDNTKGVSRPADDGIFLVNLSTLQSELLLSLNDVACGTEDDYEHYFNHLSFSPDGKYFLFFHLMKRKNSEERSNDACVFNLETCQYYTLNVPNVSHYCWTSPTELLFTHSVQGIGEYIYVDVVSLKTAAIDNEDLTKDGHPSFIGNGDFYSDTYPDRKMLQRVFKYEESGKTTRPIAKLFHQPVLHNDHRCDLHPRVFINDNSSIITCDTTCTKGLRSIAVMYLRNNGRTI